MKQNFETEIPEKPLESDDSEANMWAMVLHLSMLISFSLIGLIAPIVIWQIKKDQFPIIDQHGKNAANWMISYVIYMIAGVLLSLILIGIPLVVAVAIAGIIFPIIAGIKASNGEIWAYPLSIKFFN